MARRQPPPPPPPPPSPDLPPRRGRRFRVLDARRPDFIAVPSYVLDYYGAQLGAYGLAVYLALCSHADRNTRECWPSLARIGQRIGCSRSSIVRALRLMEALGLLEVFEDIDEQGQHSNRYRLVDPEAIEGPEDTPSTDGGGAFPQTRGRPAQDTPPLSAGDRPPTSRIARSELGSSELDPVKGAPAPNAALEEHEIAAQELASLWTALMVDRRTAARRAQFEEAYVEAAELVRRGYSVAELRASLQRPNRVRTEFPRQWREEVAKRPPARPRSPAIDFARQREQARQEAQEAAQARQGAFQGKTIAELMEERRKGNK